MAGFVEIAKIVLKVGFFAAIITLIISLGLSIANLSPILTFLNGLLSSFTMVIEFTYNVLYYYTSGAFEYIYVAVMSILLTKVIFWSVYGLIQAYKIVVEWLMK